MGDYTGFVCKIKVKEKYYNLVKFLNGNTYENDLWKEAYEMSGYTFIKEYMTDGRSGFIPKGAYSYNKNWLNGYIKKDEYYFKEGIWFFGCDLKNYDNTIENFTRIILPEITKDIIFVKSKYEESDEEVDYTIAIHN